MYLKRYKKLTSPSGVASRRRFGSYFPTLLVVNDIMFIRALRRFNDSLNKLDKRVEQIPRAEIERILYDRSKLGISGFAMSDEA